MRLDSSENAAAKPNPASLTPASIAWAETFVPETEGADLERLARTVGTNDAAELHPKVPVLLVQGAEDTTVPSLLSDRLAEQYRTRGTDLEYVTVPDADHVSVLEEAAPRVRTWVEEAFAG